MYTVSNKKYVNMGSLTDTKSLMNIDGFLMASKNKIFTIQNSAICKICVVNQKLATPLANKKLTQRYQQLVGLIMELLVEDDESGETCREALNQVERFRMELLNKYRAYLKEKELEKILEHLDLLDKEIKQKLYELQYAYRHRYQDDNKRSR